MGETTHQIAMHIEHTRDDLGANLQELEDKVKSVTDWRQQFQNNPMLMVGLAFSGGVFLAAMRGGKRNRLAGLSGLSGTSAKASSLPVIASQVVTAREKQQVLEVWDNIKGALVGVAVSKVKTFLDDTIPGFGDQLRKAESRSRPSATMADIGSGAGAVAR